MMLKSIALHSVDYNALVDNRVFLHSFRSCCHPNLRNPARPRNS